jgi:hypothetical protein
MTKPRPVAKSADVETCVVCGRRFRPSKERCAEFSPGRGWACSESCWDLGADASMGRQSKALWLHAIKILRKRDRLAHEAGRKEACEACAKECDAEAAWARDEIKKHTESPGFYEGAEKASGFCADRCRALASRPKGKP